MADDGRTVEISYVEVFEYAEQRPDSIDYAITRHHTLHGVLHRYWFRDPYDWTVGTPEWREFRTTAPGPSAALLLRSHEQLNPRPVTHQTTGE